VTKRWGPNTKSELGQTKRAAAKRVRAEIRREVRTKIMPSLIDLICDPAFGEALEASGELDARESGMAGRTARPIQTVTAETVEPVTAQNKRRGNRKDSDRAGLRRSFP
jgi:hypothetical protein